MALVGTNLVRALRSALQKAKRTWPRVGDRMEVRRQALKLRAWNERHNNGAETGLLDLTYESIKAMPGSGVYELRLDDDIGGISNIRVVFLDPPGDWVCLFHMPLPVVWVLEALAKKREGWTKFDLDRFRAARGIVKERFYET